MFFPWKRPLSYLVLFSFLFQTLWPSVVWAGEVEVLRPSSSVLPASLVPFSGRSVAVAPFTLQAFVDDRVEGFDTLETQPVVVFPGGASLAETQAWFDDSWEAQHLYPGLVVTEQGLLWSQYGLNFLMALTGHLYVSTVPGVEVSTPTLRLHNLHGDVVLGGELTLAHAQIQARHILQASPNARIQRLDLWAMGYDIPEGRMEGRFTQRKGASLTTTHVTVHEGHLENLGTWRVADQGVIDLQGHDFINRQTVIFGQEARVHNQETFGNEGTMRGSSYTLEMVQGENAGTISGTGFLSRLKARSPTRQVPRF